MRRYPRVSHASSVTVEPIESRIFLSAVPVFNASSADFSNVPFMHVKPGYTRLKIGTGTSAGATGSFAFAQETLLGVNCLRVKQTETGSDPWTGTFWLARDTSGLVWLFKDTDGATTIFNATSLSHVVQMANVAIDTGFMIMARLCNGSYTVGTVVTDSGGDRAKVLSTTATLPQYSGFKFVKVQKYDKQGHLDHTSYYHPDAFAEVVTTWIDGQGHARGWALQNWPVATLSAGRLAVAGTAGNDAITLDLVGSNYRASVNGNLNTWPASSVSSIVINGGAGNNTITVGASVTKGVIINGGAGKDSITGGSGADVINGGAGNDTIRGGLGNDTIYGGTGNDLIYGEGGNDWIYAKDGSTTLSRDTVYGGTGTNHVQHDAADSILDSHVDILG